MTASGTIQDAFTDIVAWCDDNDHSFALLTVGSASPMTRFAAEVTRSNVGAVVPTFSTYGATPVEAVLLLHNKLFKGSPNLKGNS